MIDSKDEKAKLKRTNVKYKLEGSGEVVTVSWPLEASVLPGGVPEYVPEISLNCYAVVSGQKSDTESIRQYLTEKGYDQSVQSFCLLHLAVLFKRYVFNRPNCSYACATKSFRFKNSTLYFLVSPHVLTPHFLS